MVARHLRLLLQRARISVSWLDRTIGQKTSPRTWCKSGALSSSVTTLIAHAARARRGLVPADDDSAAEAGFDQCNEATPNEAVSSEEDQRREAAGLTHPQPTIGRPRRRRAVGTGPILRLQTRSLDALEPGTRSHFGGVRAAPRLRQRTLVYDPPSAHEDEAIALRDRAQPMGDRHHRQVRSRTKLPSFASSRARQICWSSPRDASGLHYCVDSGGRV